MVGATQILGGKVSAQIIKRTSLKATTLFSNAMWILGMALMGCSRNTTQAFVALFVWTFGHNRNTPVASYMQKYGAALKRRAWLPKLAMGVSNDLSHSVPAVCARRSGRKL